MEPDGAAVLSPPPSCPAENLKLPRWSVLGKVARDSYETPDFQWRSRDEFPRGEQHSESAVVVAVVVAAGEASMEFDPSRAALVCWPLGAGGGEDLAGGVGERVGGGVFVAGDVHGDLLQGEC